MEMIKIRVRCMEASHVVHVTVNIKGMPEASAKSNEVVVKSVENV